MAAAMLSGSTAMPLKSQSNSPAHWGLSGPVDSPPLVHYALHQQLDHDSTRCVNTCTSAGCATLAVATALTLVLMLALSYRPS